MQILYMFIFLSLLIIIVEIMTVALKGTGMSMEKARFQVISIVTTIGFSTRESELIVQHPIRRKIAAGLMIISYMMTATLISLVLTMFKDRESTGYIAIGLGVMAILMVFFSRHQKTLRKIEVGLEKKVRKSISKKHGKRTVEELMRLNGEYSVAEIVLPDTDCPLCDLQLRESDLEMMHIRVLNVDKGDIFIHFPTSETKLESGDKLLVYGKIESIEKILERHRN